MLGGIRVCVPVGFFYFFLLLLLLSFHQKYVISLNMSIVPPYMFVHMYIHALMPPASGLSFICNKVLFCSNTLRHVRPLQNLPSAT